MSLEYCLRDLRECVFDCAAHALVADFGINKGRM